MNVLVHAEVGWLIAQRLLSRRDRVLVTCAAVVPDLDGLSLLGGTDLYARYHHLLLHNWLGAAVTTGVVALFASSRRRTAALACAAFHLHLVADLLGSGPGWPLWYFFPPSRTEWFWDGQWDLASWQNTAIGLAATLLCLASAAWSNRTPVELFSLRADSQVVRTVRRRLSLGAR